MRSFENFFDRLSFKKRYAILSELEKDDMQNCDEARLFENPCKCRYELYFYKGERKKIMYVSYREYAEGMYRELKEDFNGNYRLAGAVYLKQMERLEKEENERQK